MARLFSGRRTQLHLPLQAPYNRQATKQATNEQTRWRLFLDTLLNFTYIICSNSRPDPLRTRICAHVGTKTKKMCYSCRANK